MKIIVNDPLIAGKFIEKYPNYYQSSLLNSLTNRERVVQRKFPRRRGLTTLLNNYVVEELYSRSDYSILFMKPNGSNIRQATCDIADIINYRSSYQKFPLFSSTTPAQICTINNSMIKFSTHPALYASGTKYDLIISDNCRFIDDNIFYMSRCAIKDDGKLLIVNNV